MALAPAGAVEQPDPLADGRRLDGWRRRPRRRGGANIRGRRQIVDRLVDRVLVDIDLVLHDVTEVDHRLVTHGQHHALDRKISGERGAEDHVAQVLVVRRPSHPRRQPRACGDGQRQLLPGLQRDIGELPGRLRAGVAHRRRSIERRPHERDRVVHHVETAGPGRLIGGADQAAVRPAVVRHVAVEIRRRGVRAAEIARHTREDEVLMVALPDAHSSVLEIERLLVLRHADPLLRRIDGCRDVAAAIHVGGLAVTGDGDRFDGAKTAGATERLCCELDDVFGLTLLRTRPKRRRNDGKRQNRYRQRNSKSHSHLGTF